MANKNIKDEIKDPKNYELAFWLSSSLNDENLEKSFNELKNKITQLGGIIGLSQLPQLKQLSYPINKERNGYFGYFQFVLNPESLLEVKKNLDSNSMLLRYLITYVPTIKSQPKAKFHSKLNTKDLKESSSYLKSSSYAQKSPETKSKEKSSQEVDMKDLDQKLNEILKQ